MFLGTFCCRYDDGLVIVAEGEGRPGIDVFLGRSSRQLSPGLGGRLLLLLLLGSIPLRVERRGVVVVLLVVVVVMLLLLRVVVQKRRLRVRRRMLLLDARQRLAVVVLRSHFNVIMIGPDLIPVRIALA